MLWRSMSAVPSSEPIYGSGQKILQTNPALKI
jgi:hypothetical protein